MPLLETSPWLLASTALALILAVPLLLTLANFIRNYLAARTTGLPLILIPISPENPIWFLLGKSLVVPLIESLPFGLGRNNITRYNYRGWEFEDKARTHVALGDAFVVVSPGRNALYVCNDEANADIFRRREDFVRPVEMLAMLDVYGRNLSTVEGPAWQRQRKITAPCFNDDTNELAWAEAARQASGMLGYWFSKGSVNSIAADTRTLSLHILASAGFGKSYAFRGHGAVDAGTASPAEQKQESSTTSYREALELVLDNCILIMAFGPGVLTSAFAPEKWRQVARAKTNFQAYMTEVYEQTKARVLSTTNGSKSSTTTKSEDRNLMSALVRSSLAEGSAGLSESEIYGNMFVFNFAGHDTTAHTFTFIVALLAAHPEVQDWIREEICAVFGADSPGESSCARAFPRLKRCLAVMLETLRLFPLVPPVKTTGQHARALAINGRTHIIPANTLVLASQVASHSHPRSWGDDALVWRPSRWISTAKTSTPTTDETLLEPHKGTFFPWSEGARACPGRKFSQVEVVGALATMLQSHAIEPVPRADESDADARGRLVQEIEEGTGWGLLLQLLRPEQIEIRVRDVPFCAARDVT